jgi:Bacterial SH3 domain
VSVEDESGGSEHSEGEELAADVPPPGPEPAAPTPRQVRARRRRRRRQIGTLLFVLVAIAVFAAAYFAIAGGDDDSKDSATASTAATTTAAPPFVASYKATTGLNVRQAPATTAPTVGVVEQGRDVTVVCVAQGEVVAAASGPNPQWLKVAGGWPVGYVSAAYVSTGEDLSGGKIPACPAA